MPVLLTSFYDTLVNIINSPQFQAFIKTFIPLFIVVDAFGDLPFVEIFSEGLERKDQLKLVNIAVLTGAIVGLVFLFFGKLLLTAMSISVGAFAIAGGIILLILSINGLVKGQTIEFADEPRVAIVPLGTPLLVGPAVITALLLLDVEFPNYLYIVLISFVLNLAIAWWIFMGNKRVIRVMGQGGVKAVSNVFNLLLAAIAVSYAINGLTLLGIIKS